MGGLTAVPAISSERLELVSMAPALLSAFLAGRLDEAVRLLGAEVPATWPGEHDARFLRMRLAQMDSDSGSQEWLIRAVVRREPRRVMIGHAGFHGPPGVNGPERERAVEVGYTVFPEHRGRGYAIEAARALIDHARTRPEVDCVIASIAPDNEPSLAIARRLGFVQKGEQWDDEDGLELVFELAL
jgi:RimJ/RimL family protein N-acetyltransferase